MKRSAAAIAVALSLPVAHAAANSGVRLAGASEWTARNGVLRLELSPALAASAERLRFITAGIDVSALARYPQPGRLEIDTRAAALPAGESELIVYVDEGNTWREVTRVPLKLLTRGGFERAEFTPKLDLANKSQFAEESQGTAAAPPRPHFADLTGRGSVGFALARGSFAFDGRFNASGSSHRPEALRYGERGAAATKADLADYTLNLKAGGTSLALGHLSYGNNPLLLSGFASRGVTLAQRLGDRLELSFNAMNGTSIVGTDNFFGLEEADHRVVSGGMGYEFFARAGALRAELLYMDASVQSRGNFNVGEIPDAEKSRGVGLRVAGASAANRVRGEVVFARSTYVNPFDPELAQDGPSQDVQPATANGYSAELSVDLLREARLFAATPFTLTTSLRHERIAPLFRSLGASLSANQRASRAGLGIVVGGAQVQLTHQRQEDNLDRIPTLLRNRTATSALSVRLPFPQWFSRNPSSSWWPAFSYQGQLVFQRALNEPVTADSGFAASHRPNQRNRQHQVALNWSRERWSFNYGVSRAEQDNRQVGRERADFSSLGHQVSATLRATDTLAFNLGLQRNRNYSVEKDLAEITRSGSAGFEWSFWDRWTFVGDYSRTLGEDSRALTASASRNAQSQLAYRFDVRSFGHKLPGQIFVRYSESASDSRDAAFAIGTAGSNRAWGAGLSLSLF